MLGRTIALPLWLVALLALLAAWAALDRLLLPGVRWFLRTRANRVLAEVKSRFQIEIRPFQLTRRQVVIDRLVYDPGVVEAATAFAEQGDGDSGPMPREVAMKRVERYAREIVPAFNAYFYFRLGYWASRWAARLLYRVRIGSVDEETLAISRDAAVVFVINHRSNMDYLLVGHLVASKTALSYAVGEWARIWPLEAMLKAMGAYFVRRRSRDTLYRRVLERYVQMATAAGVPQAIFPEGGLSRDGRLQPPKLGLLDYIVKGFGDAGGRDVVFVPVAVNYDRVLEDRTLLLDLEPQAPRPGTLGSLVRLAGFGGGQLALRVRRRWHRFGYACVSFGRPLSLRDWTHEREVDLRALGRDERFARVEELAADLMRRIGDVVPVVPVALVATVLVRDPERRFTPLELAAEGIQLLRALAARGARVYVPRGDVEYALQVGVRMLRLRRLLLEEDGLLRAAPGEMRVIAYYANSVAHLLAGEAAVRAA